MRFRLLLLVLVLFATGFALEVSADGPAPEPGPDQPEEEPLPEEKPGKLMVTLNAGGHTAPVTQVLFTPDSKVAVSVSLDRSICVWDLASGTLQRVLRPP